MWRKLTTDWLVSLLAMTRLLAVVYCKALRPEENATTEHQQMLCIPSDQSQKQKQKKPCAFMANWQSFGCGYPAVFIPKWPKTFSSRGTLPSWQMYIKNGLKSVHKPSRVGYYVCGHAERESVCGGGGGGGGDENVSTNKQLQCPKKHLTCLTYVRSKKSQDSSTAPTVPMEYDVSSL